MRTTRLSLGNVMCMSMPFLACLRRSRGLFNQCPTILARVVPALLRQPFVCDLLLEQEPGGVEPAVFAGGQGVADDAPPGTVGPRVLLHNLDDIHQEPMKFAHIV